MDRLPMLPALPEWVRWLAQDRDGSWWGYSVEPLRHDAGWYENEAGRCQRFARTEPAGWEDSLQRVTGRPVA